MTARTMIQRRAIPMIPVVSIVLSSKKLDVRFIAVDVRFLQAAFLLRLPVSYR